MREEERKRERERVGEERGNQPQQCRNTMGSAMEHELGATAKVSHLSCSLTTLNDTKRHV